MSFLKAMFASLLGTLLALLLITLFFIVIISAFGDQKILVEENSVLHITLDEPLAEREMESDLNFDPIMGTTESKIGLNLFIDNLRRAQSDNNIKGIFLEMGNVSGAPSSMLDVHNAISEFRNSGKWVVAYGQCSQRGVHGTRRPSRLEGLECRSNVLQKGT
jgi:protease-4